MGRWLRRMRGALGNAVVWGLGWFAAAIPLTAVLFATDVVSGIGFWQIAIAIGQSLGSVGFLMGGAFSLYVGIAARNQTLEELQAWRFAMGSAAIAGLAIPAFAVVTTGVGGLAGAWGVIGVVSGISATLAGAMALGTIKVAQSALASDSSAGSLPAGG